jgi:hypothetical protein
MLCFGLLVAAAAAGCCSGFLAQIARKVQQRKQIITFVHQMLLLVLFHLFSIEIKSSDGSVVLLPHHTRRQHSHVGRHNCSDTASLREIQRIERLCDYFVQENRTVNTRRIFQTIFDDMHGKYGNITLWNIIFIYLLFFTQVSNCFITKIHCRHSTIKCTKHTNTYTPRTAPYTTSN